jgi:hypothetical protein
MWLDHIGDIRLPGFVVLFAQPAVIAGVGGDAVQPESFLRGVQLVEKVTGTERYTLDEGFLAWKENV